MPNYVENISIFVMPMARGLLRCKVWSRSGTRSSRTDREHNYCTSESRMTSSTTKYPFLEEILAIKDLPLQPTYTTGNVAVIFGVSPRAIQNRVVSGQLMSRDLPGRARFLNQDIEAFLVASRKKAA